MLISNNIRTIEQVTAAVPESWSLSVHPTFDAAEEALISLRAASQCPTAIFLEFDSESDMAGRVSGLVQAGSKVLAIVADSTERDLCFEAGAHDYLLKPLSQTEIRTGLSVLYRQEPNAIFHESMLQLQRLATIGRLTSHICHEIINPLQAIRGATSLALEEADISETLKMYVNLCQDEALRVTSLVEKMRQIYRPANRIPEPIHVGKAWSEAIAAAWEELDRNHVSVREELPANLPAISGDPNQIFLAFLDALLEALDIMSIQGGSSLAVRGDAPGRFVRFRIATDSPTVQIGHPSDFPAGLPRLSLMESILASHHGGVEVGKPGGPFIMQLFVPRCSEG